MPAGAGRTTSVLGAAGASATSAGGPARLTVQVKQIHAAATAFLALFSIVGLSLYGLPFFYDFMVRDFGWSRAQVTSGNAVSKLLVGPLFGFVAGWIVDRFGPRRLMLSGILMAGTALVGLSLVRTLPLFYLFYVFNALGYVCGGPLPNQVLLSRRFDRARGKAMGFAYLGIGAGGAVAPIAANWLTERFGWPAALRGMGMLVVLIAFPMVCFIRDAPAGSSIKDAPEGSVRDGPKESIKTVPEGQGAGSARDGTPPDRRGGVGAMGPALRSPAFYLLAIGSMCSIGAVGGTMQNLKLFLSLDAHYAQRDIAGVLSLVLIVSLAGRLIMGWLADRFMKKRVMLLIYLAVASGIPLLFLAPSRLALSLFAVIFGIGLGGDYMIIPLMAAELFGVQLLGRIMGIILTADGVAEAVAPMLVAATRDRTHSYSAGFAVLIALAATGALAVSRLPSKTTSVTHGSELMTHHCEDQKPCVS